ncbi:PREDICTED: LOW QUALITY PROTEIN: advanced glycosylation end product-specific receptor [Chrysochloris asiatica]|uniref:LOW QUALITY PROTEIN: advanced glycosylation end product-specific receptor n=1 Tax=Chrysochloris asiatica TaxID=185453 RepID=A0A9B0X4M1_CHRAS|nr:PREDICTED: LOW QUALITY PROTEIN: advanced glycosylation end product-specific receptor [Chrysochloris asiatica]
MAAGAAAGAWVLVISLWGAVVSSQNITVRIGEPLMLKCKGAPKKQPQKLEWKLNTGRTEGWKVQGDWDSDSVARILSNGSLLLPAVGIQDEGTFRCQATSKNGKQTKSNYRVQVYKTPKKPEIVDPASELRAGIPNKVGTCVSEGGYPAGTLSWRLDGKALVSDGKGVFVKEETRRHPETGLFTLQSELIVTPVLGGVPCPTFSCSFSPGLPRCSRALHAAHIQPRVWEPLPLEVQLVVEPEGGAVVPGGSVRLTCETPAQPPTQIHWLKDSLRTRESTAVWLPIPPTGPSKAVLSASTSLRQARRGQMQVRSWIRSEKRQTDPQTHGWGYSQRERTQKPRKTRRKRRNV